MSTVADCGQATSSGRSASEPTKAAAFVVPNSGTGSDDVDNDERGLRMTGDDRTRPSAERRRLEEATKVAWRVDSRGNENLWESEGEVVLG